VTSWCKKKVFKWKSAGFLVRLSVAFAVKWTVGLFANASVKGNFPIRSASAWAARDEFDGI
jgi:hypothetical protein